MIDDDFYEMTRTFLQGSSYTEPKQIHEEFAVGSKSLQALELVRESIDRFDKGQVSLNECLDLIADSILDK